MTKVDKFISSLGFSLLLLGIFLLNGTVWYPGLYREGEVVEVTDGDTFKMIHNGQEVTVRYVGIDTPETVDPHRPVGCFGHEASQKNKELLLHQVVTLEKDISDTDKYGRLLRFVYLQRSGQEPLFMNDYLVSEGFAKAYNVPPDSRLKEHFLELENKAKESKKGLWASCL